MRTSRFVLVLFLSAFPVLAEQPSADPAPRAPEAATAPAAEEITITGHRGLAIGETAQASSLLVGKEIRAVAARTPDDALRGIASIGAPRAGSSLEHPTAQSVSMRGVGGGRTLVLLDGVPMNDAFGGWIQWNKMPMSALQRVEVLRGGGANVYGNLAMGGAIQLFSPSTDQDRLDFDGQYGGLDTYRVFAEGTRKLGDSASLTILGHSFRSGGAFVVAPEQRGAIDQAQPFESQNASARADFRLSDQVTAFASGGYYRQAGTTGTALSANSLWIADGSAGADFQLDANTLVKARLFGSDEQYDNVNTRIGAGRASELMAVHNQVPVTRVGGSVVWSRRWESRSVLTLGVDGQQASATNHDLLYDSKGVATGSQNVAGGSQALLGAFAEWSFTPVPALTTTAGVRADLWDNYGGSTLSAAGVAATLPEKREGAVTPRFSAVYRFSSGFALRGAAYTGFRAPNLNELYRGFLSGGVTTLPNSSLGAERLMGAEVGTDIAPVRGLTFGITGYVNALSDLVQSVTIDPNTKLRENVAQARALGVEVDARWRPARVFTLVATYALTRSRVVSSPENPDLVGERLPQTPLHRGGLTGIVDLPDLFRASARVWSESRSYSDDRNGFELPAFAQVDLSIARRLTKELEMQLSMSNVLDSRVVTSRSASLVNVGAPRTAWVGLRGTY